MKRLHWTILAGLCFASLLACGYFMSGRAAAFNAAQDRKLWVFQDVNRRTFKFAGRDVLLMDTKTAKGEEQVQVRFGDQNLWLSPYLKPGDPALPELVRHANWMRVLRFAEMGRRSFEEFKAHLEEGNDRLALVVKRPLTTPDPRTGEVWQWTFDFHEFLQDGTIRTEGLRFPKTKGDKAPKPGELRIGSWQMEAALQLMPKTPPDSLAVGRPTAAFRGDAMKSLGWTLPAAATSVCGVIVFSILAAAPRRKRQLP